MKLIDLKDMPGANLSVPNGMDSVSRGLVNLVPDGIFPHKDGAIYGCYTHTSPHCVTHGAMNRVSHDGIYRCLQHGCHVGCYRID